MPTEQNIRDAAIAASHPMRDEGAYFVLEPSGVVSVEQPDSVEAEGYGVGDTDEAGCIFLALCVSGNIDEAEQQLREALRKYM